MDKKELRKIAKNLRSEIKNKDVKSNIISTRLRGLDIYKKSSSIFVFISFADEISTCEIIENCIKDNKLVFVPKIIDGKMILVEFNDFDCLEINSYGIREPKASKQYKGAIDLTITPGLLFDKSGHRLGYGGGYYDRFFENSESFKLGIAFSEQVVDSIPYEKYDIPLDAILTDEEFLNF